MENPSHPSVISHLIDAAEACSEAGSEDTVQHLLRAMRLHLDMDVAFISEFDGDKQLFPYVEASSKDRAALAQPGDLQGSLCRRVTRSQLPQLMPDTADFPEAAALPVTQAFGIGAYLGVPLEFSDGTLYGTLCCVNHLPDHTLNARDVAFLQVFAAIIGRQLERDIAARREQEAIEQRIGAVLEGDGLSIVYQPIYEVPRRAVVGFESLSRFAPTPCRTPDVWFAEAARAGLGVELELKAIRLALQGLPQIAGHLYVSVNASPATILSDDFKAAFEEAPLERVVLEITEHALIERYEDMMTCIRALQQRGMRVAVDDAGAGYASFRHILHLKPEKIKLDMSLTRDIDTDLSRQALAAALVGFAQKTGSVIVAEGVETESELAMLQSLGVARAQGYLLGKPMPLAQAVALLEREFTLTQEARRDAGR